VLFGRETSSDHFTWGLVRHRTRGGCKEPACRLPCQRRNDLPRHRGRQNRDHATATPAGTERACRTATQLAPRPLPLTLGVGEPAFRGCRLGTELVDASLAECLVVIRAEAGPFALGSGLAAAGALAAFARHDPPRLHGRIGPAPPGALVAPRLVPVHSGHRCNVTDATVPGCCRPSEFSSGKGASGIREDSLGQASTGCASARRRTSTFWCRPGATRSTRTSPRTATLRPPERSSGRSGRSRSRP
jgi:hypothetical protein